MQKPPASHPMFQLKRTCPALSRQVSQSQGVHSFIFPLKGVPSVQLKFSFPSILLNHLKKCLTFVISYFIITRDLSFPENRKKPKPPFISLAKRDTWIIFHGYAFLHYFDMKFISNTMNLTSCAVHETSIFDIIFPSGSVGMTSSSMRRMSIAIAT